MKRTTAKAQFRWTLARSTLVMLIAAGMAIVGLALLGNGTLPFTSTGNCIVIGLSMLLWIVLARVVERCNVTQAIAVGLLSPLVGAMLIGQYYGLLFILVNWYTAFPVGVVTALLVRWVMRLNRRSPVKLPSPTRLDSDSLPPSQVEYAG